MCRHTISLRLLLSVAIISKKTKLDARAAPEPDAACGPHEHKAVPIFFFLIFPSVHGAICVIALFYTDTYCPLRSKIFFNTFGTFFTFGQKQVRNTLHILRRSCTLNLDRELISAKSAK